MRGKREGRQDWRVDVVKHDDWRSAAPFFEVVAAKLQGPSPGPETLAWPPNYHYGGSPFRARGPLLGTKLLGRGPARRSPLYLLLLSTSLRLASYISSCSPLVSIDPQISSSTFTGFLRFDRRLSTFLYARLATETKIRSLIESKAS